MTKREMKTIALAGVFLLALIPFSEGSIAAETSSQSKNKSAKTSEAGAKSAADKVDAVAKGETDSESQESQEDTKESETADSSTEAAEPVDARPVRDKWALIVGIGSFKNKDIPKLKYATKDANDFYKYLINEANFRKDHVRILLNEDATERRIMSEVGDKFLARVARPDDIVVVFMSSHGSPAQLDAKKEKNYLIAYDSDPKALFSSGIEMQKVNEIIKERIDAKRVLLVLDACHSGHVKVNKNAKGLFRVGNFDAQALAQGSGQMVICSSAPDEQSWESKRYENGVFTRKLLENLRKHGPKTPIEEAVQSSILDVNNEVKEDYPGMRQTPQLHSAWKGEDLILAVRPIDPQPIPRSIFEELEPDSSPDNLRKRRSNQFVHGHKQSADLRSPEKLVLTRKFFSDVENPKEAYTAACEAQAAHFNEPDFYYRKALVQIQLKKYGSAMQTLKGVIVDNPNKYEYYLARGYCFYKMGQKGLAFGDIRTAQFKNPLLPKQIVFGD